MPRTNAPVVTAFGSGDQPVFDLSGGLALRSFAPGDEAIVHAAFTDPDIVGWHQFRIESATEAHAVIEQTRSKWAAGARADWLIEEDGDGVGRVGLHADAMRGTAEVAYWLLPRGRGRGLATKSVRALTEWAHGIGFHHILLQHSVHNVASCAVAERLGYRFEGVSKESHFHADGWHDMHWHAHVAGDPLT